MAPFIHNINNIHIFFLIAPYILLPIFKLEENNFPGFSKNKTVGILELINMLAGNVQYRLTLGPQTQSMSGGNPFWSDVEPFWPIGPEQLTEIGGCGSCGMLIYAASASRGSPLILSQWCDFIQRRVALGWVTAWPSTIDFLLLFHPACIFPHPFLLSFPFLLAVFFGG